MCSGECFLLKTQCFYAKTTFFCAFLLFFCYNNPMGQYKNVSEGFSISFIRFFAVFLAISAFNSTTSGLPQFHAQFETQLELAADHSPYFYLTLYPSANLQPFADNLVFVKSYTVADFETYLPVLSYLRSLGHRVISPEQIPDNFGQKIIVSLGKNEHLPLEFVYDAKSEEKEPQKQFAQWIAQEFPAVYAKNVIFEPEDNTLSLVNLGSNQLTQQGITWIGKWNADTKFDSQKGLRVPISYRISPHSQSVINNPSKNIYLPFASPNGYQNGQQMQQLYYFATGGTVFGWLWYYWGWVWGVLVLAGALSGLGWWLADRSGQILWKKAKKSAFKEELPLKEVVNTIKKH